MYKKTILFLTFFQTFIIAYAEIDVGKLNENNDHGVWLEQNLNVQFNKDWLFYFHTEERWGDNYKRFWFFEHWSILQYDITKYIQRLFCLSPDSIFKSLSIGPGFAQSWELQKNTNNLYHWAMANRPEIVSFLKMEWRDWSLTQRLVGEYKRYITKHYRSHALCRYRLWINSPWNFTSIKLNPFLANEFFFRKKKSNQSVFFYENRMRVGFNTNLIRHMTAIGWWQWRTIKQLPGNKPLWKFTYQLGLTVNWIY